MSDYITLDPPYLLSDIATTHTFIGWAEVDDASAPAFELTLNGRAIPFEVRPRPDVQAALPELTTAGIRAKVDFREALKGLDTQQDQGGFLVELMFRSDDRVRTFEYAVSSEWLRRVFGEPLRARPVPPSTLQIRVAGAAAGAFCHSAMIEAQRIEALAEELGVPLAAGQDLLDFGCGPGRLICALAPRHRGVRFHGCDIDAEAIDWCRHEMADFGAFHATGHLPPLPFADETFDLIYGLSVFTHLPEDHQFAWLDELRRVLKPGGGVITTVINPFAYDLPAQVVASAQATGFAYWGDAATTDGLPAFYRLAYHTPEYVRREWARGFEVVRVGRHDLNDTQDAVLLRRI